MAKAIADLRSLARAQTETCVNVLTGIVRARGAPPSARVAAAGLLLERGWGKADQQHSLDGDIRVTIRQILEVHQGDSSVTIEHDATEKIEGCDK
jgi:hypothetical protein